MSELRTSRLAERQRVRLILDRPHERSRWRLLMAAPAVLALGGCVGVGLLLALRDDGAWVREYESRGMRALDAGDRQTARLCYQRLLQGSPNDPSYRAALELTGAGPAGDARR